jgi:UDP-GlcNAc:undecaprenyl-phosphate GlcNAc-1-phosphate transferase
MKIFILFFATLFFSFLAVPLFIKISKKLDILDRPDSSHKSHQYPVPYLGGMAILSSFLASIFITTVIFEIKWEKAFFLILTLPLILISLLGLIDDLKPQSATLRLVIQNLVSAITVSFLAFGGFIEINITESKFINLIVCNLWVVAVCNFLNMFDNHDGSAAGVSFIIFLGIAFLSYSQQQLILFPLAISFAASIAGLLIFNFPPARIYLGDSGAMLLGFAIGSFSIQLETSARSPLLSWAIPILLIGVLATDFTVSVFSRIRRGISPMVGDKAHIAHRLLRLGFTKTETTLIIWSIALFFVLMSVAVNYLSVLFAGIAISMAVIVYTSLIRYFLSLQDE